MKKLILIVCFSLVAIIIGLIVAGATIQVKHAMDINEPDRIEVNSRVANPGDSSFDSTKIYEMLIGNSKSSYLSWMFSKKAKQVTVTPTSSAIVSSTEDYYIKLVYNEEQTLMLNKDVYKNPNNSEITSVKYKMLIINLGKTSGTTALKIYVINDADNNKSGYYITQYGNYSDLYNYLTEKAWKD